MAEKPKTSYNIMTSVLTNYQPTPEEKRTINSFFLCRWLSNNPRSIFIGNAINRYYIELPLIQQYDIAKFMLSGKIKYIQFPKKEKNKNKTIDNISRFYKISIETALDYYELMTDEEKDEMTEIYNGA